MADELPQLMRNAYGNLTQSGWWNNPRHASLSLGSRFNRPRRAGAASRVRRAAVNRVRTALESAFQSRSASQTITTSKKGKQVAVTGGHETKSNFDLIKPNKTKLGKLELADGVCSRSVGLSAATTQGLQTAVNLTTLFDSTDLANIAAAVNRTSTALSAARVFMGLARSTILITNAETTNCHMTIYTCMARQDAGALNTDAASTFLAGYAAATGGAAANATLPGVTPYGNVRFTEAYKILQETPIVLSPGQTHTHYIRYAPNKMVNFQRYLISGVAGGSLGQLSLHTFIIFHGTPVHDDTTETSVTIGVAKLDYVLMEEIHYKQGVTDYPSNSITTTLATNLTGFQMAENAPTDIADNS